MNGFFRSTMSFFLFFFFCSPLLRTRAKESPVSILVHGVNKNGPVYLSGFRADTLVGPRSSRNAPSISTILLPTHRADRTGWLPKIKKKKRERKKKRRTKKEGGGNKKGRERQTDGKGWRARKRGGRRVVMVHWVSDRKGRAAGRKMFQPEINVTDTPARRSINCLMVHREIVGEVVVHR